MRKAIVLREHLTDPVLKEGWQQWMAAHGLDSSVVPIPWTVEVDDLSDVIHLRTYVRDDQGRLLTGYSADGTLGPLVVEAQVHHGGTVAPFPTGIWRAGG